MPDARQSTQISVIKCDITTMDVDVIVNAANSGLSGGGGVDGAIHAAAGPGLIEECQELFKRDGPCATGNAVVTSGGRLKATWIVHTVGPIWDLHGPAEATELLTRCYHSSLDIATEVDAGTVAFSAISTGVYGFPKELAAPAAVSAVASWLQAKAGTHNMQDIALVCFDTQGLELTKLAVAALGGGSQ